MNRVNIPKMKEKILKSYYSLFNNNSWSLIEEDWDNIIILDACRYDMFEDLNSIDGQLESRWTYSSNTPEYIENNFVDETYNNTIYVTSNPIYRVDEWVSGNIKGSFDKIIDVWIEGWDDKLGTVHPRTMYDTAVDVNELYPNKKLVIHFMQPHYPFIGNTGKEEIGKQDLRGRVKALEQGDIDNPRNVWELLDQGEVAVETIWKAYRENLQIVLEYTERLVEDLCGKTIITADHGNLVRERAHPFPFKLSGHPKGIYTEKLVKVPWHTVKYESRKEISDDKSERRNDIQKSDESVEERLSDLGYL
ncbi:hypothetical protein [Natrialba chahannaoensis]|uniref:hypothetical protein n=1 Tax=Natrialba chahannaoensis TaxID=68911 RepID=UPI00126836E6|nr:hypothetical protein [Natrialba chahannaoensis]